MNPTVFDRAVAEAVLEVSRERSLPAAMERIVAMVADLVPIADAAAVIAWEGRRPPLSVATDDAVRELVDRHFSAGDSPVHTACERGRRVYSGDLDREFRWRDFSRDMATSLGVRSVVAVPLSVGGRSLGALAVYAKAVDAFDDEDQETVQIAAIHATAALADSLERRQLSRGLETRTVIGQATGIVMEQFDLDATTAFSVLRRLSQNHNEKVRDLAGRIVATRLIE